MKSVRAFVFFLKTADMQCSTLLLQLAFTTYDFF